MSYNSFMMNRPPTGQNERRFDVIKRKLDGQVSRVGVVRADNKVQADSKARMMYGKTLHPGESVWTVDVESEAKA
jgi:hypothetical protein